MFSFASLSICLVGLGSPKNQTPAGHLMTECISELIRHCGDIWTQTADTIHRERHRLLPFAQGWRTNSTCTRTHTRTHPVRPLQFEWWSCLGSNCLEYCMGLVGGENPNREEEKWIQNSSFLFFTCYGAAADSSWWSVLLGLWGICLFCLKGPTGIETGSQTGI